MLSFNQEAALMIHITKHRDNKCGGGGTLIRDKGMALCIDAGCRVLPCECGLTMLIVCVECDEIISTLSEPDKTCVHALGGEDID